MFKELEREHQAYSLDLSGLGNLRWQTELCSNPGSFCLTDFSLWSFQAFFTGLAPSRS